jgi:hypothetical protein
LWAPRRGATLQSVCTAGEPTRLGLEVRFDAQPIQGRVYDREDDRRLDRSFSGWLGLLAAIEAARGAEPTPAERKGGA